MRIHFHNSSDDLARPTTPIGPTKPLTPPTTPRKSTPAPPSPAKSPRNPQNSSWVLQRKKLAYITHLQRWSLNHDANAYFHGTISLIRPESQGESLELGKSIRCLLSQDGWTDTPQIVTIRLFAPREEDGKYRLVIRSGSGWIESKDFLGRIYFLRMGVESKKCRSVTDQLLPQRKRSTLLEHKPEAKDAVAIHPLFRLFTRLPIELQQHIFGLIIKKTTIYRPARDRGVGFCTYDAVGSSSTSVHRRIRRSVITKDLHLVESPTKLVTIFRVSKSINSLVIPWIYRTTNFHFEQQGFTNFMLLSGPTNRRHIKQVTLAFGHYALLHCVRWFGPDPVFELFDPPLSLDPPAMQYFWRCQIQDLAKELHLSVLTIDINGIPEQDIPFVARCLRQAFGSVDTVRFITAAGVIVKAEDNSLRYLKPAKTWGELCRDAFERYRRMQWHDHAFSEVRRRTSAEELEYEMEKKKGFFDWAYDFRTGMEELRMLSYVM